MRESADQSKPVLIYGCMMQCFISRTEFLVTGCVLSPTIVCLACIWSAYSQFLMPYQLRGVVIECASHSQSEYKVQNMAA
jgi:hypothetical protein